MSKVVIHPWQSSVTRLGPCSLHLRGIGCSHASSVTVVVVNGEASEVEAEVVAEFGCLVQVVNVGAGVVAGGSGGGGSGGGWCGGGGDHSGCWERIG